MQGFTRSRTADGNFDDWIVRDVGGRDWGHYPSREAAELGAQALARERKRELIIPPSGR